MNPDNQLSAKTAQVYQALAEAHDFIAALDVQIHSGQFPMPGETDLNEALLPNGWTPIVDANSWLADEF
ncbi:hypothetical protein ACQ4M4_05655 [Leptolyngbya sp. AN02str]|uniref:hypothetical protein n=1 Tax=Leptolyngbya sp. AN02str TaxID=3423363 RepID=UPI003D31D534